MYFLNNINEINQVKKEEENLEDIIILDDIKLINKPVVKELLNRIIYAVDGLFTNYFYSEDEVKYNYRDFVITKSVSKDSSEYKGKSLPGHVALADKMRKRGVIVPPNSRIEYFY